MERGVLYHDQSSTHGLSVTLRSSSRPVVIGTGQHDACCPFLLRFWPFKGNPTKEILDSSTLFLCSTGSRGNHHPKQSRWDDASNGKKKSHTRAWTPASPCDDVRILRPLYGNTGTFCYIRVLVCRGRRIRRRQHQLVKMARANIPVRSGLLLLLCDHPPLPRNSNTTGMNSLSRQSRFHGNKQ
jgi:hypothetical protein